MRLYDTARRAVVPFEPGRLVTMYTCGITPYDATHVGHAWVFVVYDVLQRRLRDLGHETRCVRNITDVDDPLLAKARELGVHYLDLAGKVVVSMANALTRKGDEFEALVPEKGSVAAGVQDAVPDALVAAAFHHVPARSLADLDTAIQGDVIVCSDHDRAFEATAELVRQIPDLRPLHGGTLASAAPVEAFTAVLLGVNKRYRARAVVHLNGIP